MRWRELTDYGLLSYWTVLVAELVGDRSIYTVASLAMRFRPVLVYAGISAAWLCKMLAAVWLGSILSSLPLSWTSGISAATFFATAGCLWFKKRGHSQARPAADAPAWQSAVLVSFSAVFFAEWADFGQLSAAALAARYDAWGAIWMGGSLALCTKGAFAITLGLRLRRRLPDRMVRALATASCLVLGLSSLYDLLSH